MNKKKAAYQKLLQTSPEAAASIETMAASGWSPPNIIHLLKQQYPSRVARLIAPALDYITTAPQTN